MKKIDFQIRRTFRRIVSHSVPATRFGLYMLTVALATTAISCEDHRAPLPGQGIQSNSPKPDWGPTITPQMLAIIEELDRLAPRPITELTPAEARSRPSFKDAVNSLLDKNNIPRPTANVTISERMIPGWNGAQIRAKIYTPNTGPAVKPVIVYFHGGGWVIANSEVYEYSTLALAEETGAVVVSVNYRLAPEFKFPTAHEDAYRAYEWVKNNAALLGGDPNKVATAGESAGGNMAVTTAMLARDRGIGVPVHILSVFPVANNDLFTESYLKYQNAKPLSKPAVQWFVDRYFNSPADGDNPLISLIDAGTNLSGLPPTTIIGAEIDPLQTEGMQLRDKLISQGVQVTYQLFPGVTHEFFGMYAILPEAQQAQALAATRLREAFK